MLTQAFSFPFLTTVAQVDCFSCGIFLVLSISKISPDDIVVTLNGFTTEIGLFGSLCSTGPPLFLGRVCEKIGGGEGE